MSNIAGVLCDAMNLLHFKLRLQLAGMCTVLGLMWALSGQGILGVVAGLVVGEALRFAAYFVFLAPRLHYRLDHGLRALAAVATSGALSLAGVSALLWLTQGLPMGVRLLAAVVGGALALAASLVGLVAWLSGTPAGLVGAQQLPGWRPLALRLAHSAQADGALP
jgi:hypothetical protein